MLLPIALLVLAPKNTYPLQFKTNTSSPYPIAANLQSGYGGSQKGENLQSLVFTINNKNMINSEFDTFGTREVDIDLYVVFNYEKENITSYRLYEQNQENNILWYDAILKINISASFNVSRTDPKNYFMANYNYKSYLNFNLSSKNYKLYPKSFEYISINMSSGLLAYNHVAKAYNWINKSDSDISDNNSLNNLVVSNIYNFGNSIPYYNGSFNYFTRTHELQLTLNYTNDISSYNTGYNDGKINGYNDGYNDGYQNGTKDMSATINEQTWLTSIFKTIDTCLSVEIFPKFKLWYLISIPIMFALVRFVISFFRWLNMWNLIINTCLNFFIKLVEGFNWLWNWSFQIGNYYFTFNDILISSLGVVFVLWLTKKLIPFI